MAQHTREHSTRAGGGSPGRGRTDIGVRPCETEGATQDSQRETMRSAAQRSRLDITFKPGDRVCKRIPGHANKLQYLYSGPYRVEEAISATRYRLRDLENRRVKDEVHISNLRPYHTVVDESPVEPDEYLVEELLACQLSEGRAR